MNTTEEKTIEETIEKEPQTVLKDNKLNVLEIGATVYVPYLSVIDNVYETRECVIESIGDIVENNAITIFYNCKVSNTDNVDGEKMTLNILANVSTSFEESERELNAFLETQIVALEDHTIAMEKQLEKNKEHMEMFKAKLNK